MDQTSKRTTWAWEPPSTTTRLISPSSWKDSGGYPTVRVSPAGLMGSDVGTLDGRRGQPRASYAVGSRGIQLRQGVVAVPSGEMISSVVLGEGFEDSRTAGMGVGGGRSLPQKMMSSAWDISEVKSLKNSKKSEGSEDDRRLFLEESLLSGSSPEFRGKSQRESVSSS
ncbi:UNVERIFIED_CONTAM: hypothetical protein Sradi_5541300 [Sesamum radiatum]|uniref:Uncharacterized protein n=1 Tax=Sesamum radiatum TaxID=300843 RepID=A0AAW2LFX0_SESRA